MEVENIYELFGLDGEEFVVAVFKNLLGRDPDEQGLRYYLGRLSMGECKSTIIFQVAKSSECRPYSEIKGLKKLVANENYAVSLVFGIFTRKKRFKRSLLGAMQSQIQYMNKLVNLLGDTKMTEVDEMHPQNFIKNEITPEIVRSLYLSLLNREPGSESAIAHYLAFNKIHDVIDEIVNSEEFIVKHLKRIDSSSSNFDVLQVEYNKKIESIKKINCVGFGVNEQNRTPLESCFRIYEC